MASNPLLEGSVGRMWEDDRGYLEASSRAGFAACACAVKETPRVSRLHADLPPRLGPMPAGRGGPHGSSISPTFTGGTTGHVARMKAAEPQYRSQRASRNSVLRRPNWRRRGSRSTRSCGEREPTSRRRRPSAAKSCVYSGYPSNCHLIETECETAEQYGLSADVGRKRKLGDTHDADYAPARRRPKRREQEAGHSGSAPDFKSPSRDESGLASRRLREERRH
ncbi:hypothetical protein SAMD00023353_4800450 [Rosellinia necatrix]|uniref:Uncharacterized protein n=1 Tax=Rosellinia necatrix TaxID=77044 RepID=A0A1W2TQC0_ROSNE|nr:hypothetical protein SAMD00023353_4800450 [Rosellinia necatrix]